MKTPLITFLALLSLVAPLALQAADKPNIGFVYADDWGWGDLACHGHPEIKTPHLDQLARKGTDRKKDGVGDRFNKFDANSDGTVSVEEFVDR